MKAIAAPAPIWPLSAAKMVAVRFTVELYGKLADIAGRAVEVELNTGETHFDALLTHLSTLHPPLIPHLNDARLMLCVNDEVVHGGVFKAGDSLALLPPVSGG